MHTRRKFTHPALAQVRPVFAPSEARVRTGAGYRYPCPIFETNKNIPIPPGLNNVD
jgi:hypothetical protein